MNKVLVRFEEGLIAFLLLAATILLFTNVILRYVFSNSPTWAEEVIRYIMIWITFIGGSVCVRNYLHVGIDIFVSNAPPKIKKLLMMLAELVSALFCFIITYYGYENTMLVINTSQKSPALYMPMWFVYIAIPIGSFLMAIRFGINAWKTATDRLDDNNDKLDMSTL
ncbi:TRAP transporter small permease [Alkaliphilus serpentinus]|uniref:TRAP transporter small permease n=1 Tax=Alkaliphilus serpentinus TaxID=1482731 RepID=A0A833HNJ2_9FIRM|nr:TRAP transporter small permease [Alkaliphilus serpentinus]